MCYCRALFFARTLSLVQSTSALEFRGPLILRRVSRVEGLESEKVGPKLRDFDQDTYCGCCRWIDMNSSTKCSDKTSSIHVEPKERCYLWIGRGSSSTLLRSPAIKLLRASRTRRSLSRIKGPCRTMSRYECMVAYKVQPKG
jgi:hypothetical protein